MSDQNQGSQRTISAAFPAPPPFWKHFTPANVAKLEELKAASENGHSKDDSVGSNVSKKSKKTTVWTPTKLQALEDVPRELRYLIPPPAPTEGTLEILGESMNVTSTLPTLESQGIPRLYSRSPSPEPATASTPSTSTTKSYAPPLLKLSKSLLLNFLEYVSILASTPTQYTGKLEDIRNIFINMHHLINEYRPHQARESLIMLMEERVKKGREEIKEMERVKREIEAFLEGIGRLNGEGEEVGHGGNGEMNGSGVSASNGDGAKAHDEERRRKLEDVNMLWDLIENEAGMEAP